MAIGERLKKLREGKYSQEELADILKVSNVTISNWENGVQEPRSKRVAELAEVLGTTPAYLLGNTDSPDEDSEVKPQIRDTGKSLVYERNGERISLPPTEESYAIFRDLARLIAGREQPAVAMA